MSPSREASARAAIRRDVPALKRSRMRFTTNQRAVSIIFPCGYCGARDSRDAEHSQGCPTLPRVDDKAMREMLQRCCAAWAAGGHT